MKNLFKIKTVLAIAIIAIIGTTSCSKSSDDPIVNPPVDNTITGKAVATADLSILVQALTKANLATTLQGTGPYTVFAPTNAAFTAFLSANGFANLDAVPVPALTQILLNHVVSGTTTAAQLTNNTYIKTLAVGGASATNKLDMYVDKTSGVKLNGIATVTSPDIVASNGIIHIVNAVIGLPTLATHAVANPAFNKLESIVTSPAQAGVLAVLTGTTAYTVFAPIDAAFTAFNTELTTIANPNGLAGVSAANVTKVLQYHVIAGNKLATDLVAGTVTTALTQTFTLALTPTVKITDFNNRMSNVTPANVQCANGVIHILDKVLLPNLN